jgi:UDP-GlcNAc:undecaprenyl-phosphate GlcNAc-1-phosphate transferase
MLVALTVLAVVVTINAVNFVDGLDGLAAGIVGIAASAFFVYSYLLSRDISNRNNLNDFSSLASLITAALVGCCVGFLPHNFNPARIFMGDSGSMLIGLLLATSTIAITGQVDPSVVSQAKIVPAFFPLALPLAVLALPLIDLTLAVVRRTRAGRMPWQPDKMHLHHRLLALGHSHPRAVLIMYLWTAALVFGVTSAAFVAPATALVLGVVAVSAAAALTLGPLRGRKPPAAHKRERVPAVGEQTPSRQAPSGQAR